MQKLFAFVLQLAIESVVRVAGRNVEERSSEWLRLRGRLVVTVEQELAVFVFGLWIPRPRKLKLLLEVIASLSHALLFMIYRK